METADISETQLIKVIKRDIVNLSQNERIAVVSKILRVVPDEKVREKGSGSYVDFRDIPLYTMREIYDYVVQCVSAKNAEVEALGVSFTEQENAVNAERVSDEN